MRKVIFWLHLVAGVVAGVVILIMSVTGVLLTYEKQMIAWADSTDAALPPVAGAPRLAIDDLLAAAGATKPGETVTNLTLSAVPGAPALATIDGAILTLNPYTGAVLGESAPALRPFFRTVTLWHRYLGAETGPIRQAMKAVTGWSNVLFLLIVLGGMYLWLPRTWTWTQVRQVIWFRRGLQGKARDFNWHNALGIWCCVPLAIVIVGAMPISFPWANRAVYQMVGEEPPAPVNGARGGGAGRGEAERGAPAPLEPLWQKAEAQVDGWRTIGARVGGGGPVAFTIDRGYGGQPQLRDTLALDRATGDVVAEQRWEDQTTGRQIRTFLRFAHTGEFFGLAGQTIAGVATAGAVVLVWTGVALALRRLGAWRIRRRRAGAPSVARSHAA